MSEMKNFSNRIWVLVLGIAVAVIITVALFFSGNSSSFPKEPNVTQKQSPAAPSVGPPPPPSLAALSPAPLSVASVTSLNGAHLAARKSAALAKTPLIRSAGRLRGGTTPC